VSQQGVDPLALVLGLPAGLEDEVPQPMYGQQPDELPQLLHVMNSDLGELWTPIRVKVACRITGRMVLVAF